MGPSAIEAVQAMFTDPSSQQFDSEFVTHRDVGVGVRLIASTLRKISGTS